MTVNSQKHSNFWSVKLKDETTVCVSPDVKNITSFVLLEQRDWFESEMDFARAFVLPDMHIIDIGANHGVYALTFSRRLTTGHVWAFEPAAATGNKLAQSILENNVSDRLTLVRAGVSDSSRKAVFYNSSSSELSSLHKEETVNTISEEEVELVSLDDFFEKHSITVPIDFLKLDAEGEEIAVLEGGKKVFSEQSPLVMCEAKSGSGVFNKELIVAFERLGYDIYRLLPDINILVRYNEGYNDPFFLNFFACKQDTAKKLSERGLLALNEEVLIAKRKLESSPFVPTLSDLEAKYADYPYVKACSRQLGKQLVSDSMPEHYRSWLFAAQMLHDRGLPSAERAALLENIVQQILTTLKPPSIFFALLHVYFLNLYGERSRAVALSSQLINHLPDDAVPDSLFIPPKYEHFLKPVINANLALWLKAKHIEYCIKNSTYSIYYNNIENLQYVFPHINNPDLDISVLRGILLFSIRSGVKFSIKVDHPILDSSKEVNAAIFKEIISNSSVVSLVQQQK